MSLLARAHSLPYPGADQGVNVVPVEPVAYRRIRAEEAVRANRAWWDAQARSYQAEHGELLGDADCVWGPEGLREADAHLLGDVTGLQVLEVGCGAGQCGRWLLQAGARVVVGVDVSWGQLACGHELDIRTGVPLPTVQADALRLPFAAAMFDVVCSSYGAVPFVADSATLMAEVARVLRPGGRWVFATSHPMRWALPDDPGPRGLRVTRSYFDRTPYVESDEAGVPTYVEAHRTIGDRVREIVAAGLVLVDLVEPEWPPDNQQTWGGWSPLRGRLIPGTAIFVCRKPATDALGNATG